MSEDDRAAGPGEERPGVEARDGTAGETQDKQGLDAVAGADRLSGEVGKDKPPSSTADQGEPESVPSTTAKDTDCGSSDMAAPKTGEPLKAEATESRQQDTAAPVGAETQNGGDESEKRTNTATKEVADTVTETSSKLPPSEPQGPDVAPLAKNGHASHESSRDQSSLCPKNQEQGAEKDERGNVDAPALGSPPLPEPEPQNTLLRSEQEDAKNTGDPKSSSTEKKALLEENTTETPRPEADSVVDSVALEAPGSINTEPTSPVTGDRLAEFFQVIDDSPPPSAPFPHRFVTLRSGDVTTIFDINLDDILGGGRFGDVHTCTVKATGLQLVAKVIKFQDSKDKEMGLNEVDVMNQLDHQNLIQMYDALETPSSIILFLEYVEGGELFERIIDENYHLTEMDAMVFVRQICEGISYMHQMYVLHLDLKPENIVCVSQTGHMVKIIDFGLARRYKPREKLRVSFGTPEFVAPEVVNFDYVSFPTDMWSLGVITYMMLSGLSPFLGDHDTETMNNVLSSEVDFNEEPFENVSDEAKEFISNLLIRDKSGRLSAGQCLRHPWLNNLAEKAKRCNRLLKSQIELRKYMMRRKWKKNFIAVTAANRFKKISSVTSLATLEM
ncbi:myosin light chain kinase 2, skeletal/cardiac muscle [Lissotriton helveticus]